MQVQITRWGTDLGIHIPPEIAARLGLSEGSRVDVTPDGDRIIVSVARPIYTLDELLAGMTPEAMRGAFEWGPDRGHEIVE